MYIGTHTHTDISTERKGADEFGFLEVFPVKNNIN